MSSNSALVTSSLDFDTIKANLVTYLQGQPQFKGYDFLGSNLSVLIDLLAYNTYYNNFYTNMAISEAFLDSAQIMDSVVSRAKELNYTPRSKRSATAQITLSVTPQPDNVGNYPANIYIPKYSQFSSRIDTSIFTFTTDQDIVLNSVNNYTTSNISIYEGTVVTEQFVYDSTLTDQKFLLSNPNIDTTSISVHVLNSLTDTNNTEFIQASTLLGYNNASKIFFIQGSSNGRYELIFGDGNIGQALINGNVISVTYRVCAGSNGNLCKTFIPINGIGGYGQSQIGVKTELSSYGGSDAETIDSIKYNAPRHYQTQQRAVTNDDYRIILLQKFQNIRAVNVYGGETVYPPKYGYVYVSVDLNNVIGVPTSVADQIAAYLLNYMPISIKPIVISPDYMYIEPTINVKYNLNLTTQSTGDIQSTILATVVAFNNDNLNDFNILFRYSKLAAAIDNSDPSIFSTDLEVRMTRRYTPTINQSEVISINFENPLIAGSVTSTAFTYNNVSGFFKDMGDGTIAIVSGIGTSGGTPVSSSKVSTLQVNVGTINYDTGLVSINFPAVSAFVGNYVNIYAKSSTPDFSVNTNSVLLIDPVDVSVNVTAARQ